MTHHMNPGFSGKYLVIFTCLLVVTLSTIALSTAAYADYPNLTIPPDSYPTEHFTIRYDATEVNIEQLVTNIADELELAYGTLTSGFRFRVPSDTNIEVILEDYVDPGRVEFPRIGDTDVTIQLDKTSMWNEDLRRTTTAHELFHVIQFEYSQHRTILGGEINQPQWIQEGTAVWMEDAIWDAINDYVGLYVNKTDNILVDQSVSLINTEVRSRPYESVLFWKYFCEQYGTDGDGHPAYQEYFDPDKDGVDDNGVGMMATLWDSLAVHYGLGGVESILADHGQDFADLYMNFAATNYLKRFGFAVDDGRSDYLEDSQYGEVSYDSEHDLSTVTSPTEISDSLDVETWAARYHRFILKNPHIGRVHVEFDGEDGFTRFAGIQVIFATDSDGDNEPDGYLSKTALPPVDGNNILAMSSTVPDVSELMVIVVGGTDGGNYDLTISTESSVEISGHVRDAASLGVPSVQIDAGLFSGATTMDGAYLLHVPADWSGQVTPILQGFSFTPTARNYVNVSVPQLNQDYAANGLPDLRDANVSPPTGTESDLFTFDVDYTDPDGDAPTTARIFIDGTPYDMTTTATDFSTFQEFQYSTYLSVGTHEYWFHFVEPEGLAVIFPTGGGAFSMEVTPEPPHIVLRRPGGYGEAQVDDSFTIEWEAQGASEIALYYDIDQDPANMTLITATTPNDGAYTWDTSAVAEGCYWIYGVIDNQGVLDTDYSSGQICINHGITQPRAFSSPVVISPSGTRPQLESNNAGDLYLVDREADGIHFRRSTDNGQTWCCDVILTSYAALDFRLVRDEVTGVLHFAYESGAAGDHVYYRRSSDEGATWSTLRDVYDDKTRDPRLGAYGGNVTMTFSSYADSWDDLYGSCSSDDGATWSSVSKIYDPPGDGNIGLSDVYINGSGAIVSYTWHIYGQDDRLRVKFSTNGGCSWTGERNPPEGDLTADAYLPHVTGYGSTYWVLWSEDQSYISRTSNLGSSWSSPVLLPAGADVGEADIVATPNYVGVVYALQNAVYYIESTDQGDTWTDPSTLAPDGKGLAGSLTTVGDDVVVVYTDSQLGLVLRTMVSSSGSCALTVTAPDGGETFVAGQAAPITWSTSGSCGSDVRIDLLHNGSPCEVLAASTPNDGSEALPLPQCGTETAGYAIRVTDLQSGAFDESDGTFTISGSPPLNVLAHWDFDQMSGTTLTDVSGNGNDGTIFEAAWTTGYSGGALSFNGVNDKVTTPLVPVYDNTQSFTWELIASFDSTETSPQMFLGLERSNDAQVKIGNQAPSGSTGDILAAARSDNYLADGGDQHLANSAALAGTGWHSYALVRDRSVPSYRLFVDRVLVDEAPDKNDNALNAEGLLPLAIGCERHNGDYEFYFKGKIDEIRISNDVLDPADMLSVSRAAVVTSEADSVLGTSVTLRGTVNPNGLPTACYFEYGVDTSYGTTTPVDSVGNGTGNIDVSRTIDSLSTGTTYHYRLVAENASGTEYGADQLFTTNRLALVSLVDPDFGPFSDRCEGIAWGDYDGDRLPDVYISTQGANHLLHNDGNDQFSDVTPTVLADAQNGRGVAWADFNNDGRLDLYLGNIETSNKLFRNDGAGAFTDVTVSPLNDTRRTESVAWADVDNNGLVDLYVVNIDGHANRLIQNVDGATFTDGTTTPLGSTSNGVGAAFGDYNNDGYLDLYVSNSGQANQLFRNDGAGVFTDVSAAPLNDAGSGRGVSWVDFDNDRDLDLYLVNTSGEANVLYKNDGLGNFTVYPDTLVADTGDGCEAVWGDLDNDGNLDLVIGNSSAPVLKVLISDGVGGFRDDSDLADLGISQVSGLALADEDGDGDLDMFVVSGNATEASILLKNELAPGNNWVEFELVGTNSNRSAIGARAVLYAGGSQQMREVSGGDGWMSQSSLTVEFGLGSVSSIDSVEISWPGGDTTVLRSGININQVHVVTQNGTVVGVENPPTRVSAFHLYPAIPNPFNPRTTIRFELKHTSHATLQVFDVAGRLVNTLVDEERDSGRHEVIWQGKDSNGRQVATGVYLYRLQAGDFVETKRMVLLK